MRPDARDRPVTPATSPAGVEGIGSGASARVRDSGSASTGHAGDADPARPQGWRADAADRCAQARDTHSELPASETSDFSHHEPALHDARGAADGILAGIDLNPQDAVPGSDGQLQCALIWCPEVPGGTRFALIRRYENGETVKLESGVLFELAPSLNLARLRQRGAKLGANEVVLILPQACASLD